MSYEFGDVVLVPFPFTNQAASKKRPAVIVSSETYNRLARALHVSLDALVFEEGERGPSEEMRLQFEAVSLLPDEDRRIVKALLDGMIVKHQAKRMVGSLSS